MLIIRFSHIFPFYEFKLIQYLILIIEKIIVCTSTNRLFNLKRNDALRLKSFNDLQATNQVKVNRSFHKHNNLDF